MLVVAGLGLLGDLRGHREGEHLKFMPIAQVGFASESDVATTFWAEVGGGCKHTVGDHGAIVGGAFASFVNVSPEGGDAGGEVVVAGTPEQVAAHPSSHTGRFLAEVLGTLPLEVAGAMAKG